MLKMCYNTLEIKKGTIMRQIKKEIMLILSCIGTSFGVVGTSGWCLYLGIKHMDLFSIWGSAIGIGITLFGLGVWSANLIIAIKQYFKEKKEWTELTARFYAPLKVENENKSKQKGENDVKRNSKDIRPK